MQEAKKKYLIIDTAAIIKGVRLEKYESELFTIQEVLDEVRDKAARDYMSRLPVQIQTRQPTDEAYKHVTEFAKKTGDIATLSRVDLKVLALTYTLEKELNGTAHIRTEPLPLPVRQPKSKNRQQRGDWDDEKPAETPSVNENSDDKAAESNEASQSIVTPDQSSTVTDEANATPLAGEVQTEDDNDEEGWITPDNIHTFNKDLPTEEETELFNVACITGDFAVQNVLLQMGMKPLGVDGVLIKSAQRWALRCFGCYNVTHQVEKVFCPRCGHDTLQKVSIQVDENGQVTISSTRKNQNTRGTKFALPLPKGGRNDIKVITSEDQMPHAKKKTDIDYMDPDAILLGQKAAPNRNGHKYLISGKSRRNPNEARHSHRRK